MRRILLFFVLFITTLAWCGFSLINCKMKYKEHYRIAAVQLELLKTNGQNMYKESILDPASTIANGDSVMLYLRFENEFFSTGVKTKNFPKRGSLGPVDTIQSLHFTLQAPGFTQINIDSVLFSPVTGRRIELSSPLPLPGHNICLRNPFVSFSSISEFIAKFNSREPEVLFEELKDNGLILGFKPSVLAGDTTQRKVDFVVTLQLTDGRTFSDTASAVFTGK